MALQAVGPSLNPGSLLNSYSNDPRPVDNGAGRRVPARVNLNATVAAEYYSSTKVALEYTSKDGDTVSFSFESLEYQKAIMEVEAEGSPEEMKNLIKQIKEEYLGLKKELLRKFIESTGGNAEGLKDTEKAAKAQKLQIPEYWNAENTSQRIVDFALSFAGLFEGSATEYLEMAKKAIGEGFSQARDLLGDLPDEVSALVDETYDLVMKKLDQWGAEQGIAAGEQQVADAGQMA